MDFFGATRMAGRGDESNCRPIRRSGTSARLRFQRALNQSCMSRARDFGVARSTDDGRSWVLVNEGLPSRDVTTVATHAKQHDTAYAYIPGRGISMPSLRDTLG
jgi:hypothetical protein